MENEKEPRARGSQVLDLGQDVKLETETLEPDLWAHATLRDIGKSMKPGGLDYKGSVAVHYYVSNTLSGPSKDIQFKHQIIGDVQGKGLADAISEQVASFSIADLALKLRQHYNPDFKFKTRNSNDKRGN